MYRFVLLFLLVSGAVGQIVINGVCDYTNIGGYVSAVDFEKMFGSWNQIARIQNNVEVGQCSSVTLGGTYESDGSLSGVQTSWLEVFNNTKIIHNGTIEAQSLVDGIFYMNTEGFIQGQFVIQSTNYTDYAILYSCYTLTTSTKAVIAWQYHRKAELTSSEQDSIEQIIKANPDLTNATWTHISHSKTACGNAAVSLAVSHILIILASLFIGKEYV